VNFLVALADIMEIESKIHQENKRLTENTVASRNIIE
jgi:hypothetical protein